MGGLNTVYGSRSVLAVTLRGKMARCIPRGSLHDQIQVNDNGNDDKCWTSELRSANVSHCTCLPCCSARRPEATQDYVTVCARVCR